MKMTEPSLSVVAKREILTVPNETTTTSPTSIPPSSPQPTSTTTSTKTTTTSSSFTKEDTTPANTPTTPTPTGEQGTPFTSGGSAMTGGAGAGGGANTGMSSLGQATTTRSGSSSESLLPSLPDSHGSGSSSTAGSMVAIIGSVVGSLVIVVVIVGFVLYKRRQHRLRAKGLDEESSQGSGDEDEDYEIKGSPPSSPRLGPLSAGDNYARSPQVVPIGVEQPESQTLTLADEKSGVGFVNLNGGRDQRSPQDHERKDQLDRVLQMHREQLYQLQELLKQHQMTNPRSHSAPHTLMDDGEGKEEGRPVWQSPSPFSRRGEPQGDGNTETPLSGSVPGSETSSLYRSESTTPMTSSAVTVVSGLEIEYLDGKILVDDEDELRDLLKSFAEINARYDQQIQRIQEGL